MLRFHLAREFNALWRPAPRLAALALYAALIAWSVADGVSWHRHAESVLADVPADLLTDRSEWMADLESAEAGEEISPYAARPMSLTFLAALPPGPLAALAGRNEAMQPHTALISGWRSEVSLFQRYEVEGPVALGAGRLDLAFVVVAVLPLLVLLLSFDVLSRDREAGRFRLFLIQGGRAGQTLIARLIAVALPAFAIPAIAILVAALLLDAPVAATRVWIAGLAIYTAFWSAVAALVAVSFRQVSTGALAAVTVWALLVVVVPSTVRFSAEALYPLPSRVSYLTEARLAEGATRRNLAERAEIFMAEHPDEADAPDEAVPGFYRASYLANVDINTRTRGLVDAFEGQQAQQRGLVGALQFLSPAIMLNQVLQASAGTGPARSADFRRQARAHLDVVLDAIGPATVGRNRLTVEEARRIPEFAFTEPAIPLSGLIAMIWMLVLAAGGTLLALRRAQRLN